MELKNAHVDALLKQADRFCCVIEMAAYLAMVMLGGPKKCLLWYCDAQGRVVDNAKPGKKEMRESLAVCQDDVELALLLIKQFQALPTDEKKVSWCNRWQLNYATLLSVDLLMNRLLGERICRDEGDHEIVRSIDLRLIDKLRLLIFHHVVRGDQATLPGIYYSPAQQRLRIHPDSICYGRQSGLRCLYFSSAQQDNGNEVEAEQVILLPDWCPELLAVSKYDIYDLALLIARKTRVSNKVKVRSRWENHRPGQRLSFLGEDLDTLIKPFAAEERDRLAKDVIKIAKYVRYQGASYLSARPGGEAFRIGEMYKATVVRIFPHPYNYAQVKLHSGQYSFLYGFSGEEENIDVFTDEHLSVGGSITVRFAHRDEETGHLFFKLVTGGPQNDLEEKAIITMVSRNKARVCLASGVFAVLSEVKVNGCRVKDMSKVFAVGDEIKVKIIAVSNAPAGGKQTTYVSADIERA
jgi:hypothetical protein